MSFRFRAAVGAAAAALASALVLSACGGSSDTTATSGAASADGSSLVVYSGREEEYMKPVFDAFTTASGTAINVRYGDSPDLALLIGEEGDKTPAQVFISQSPGSQSYLDQKSLLSQLPDETLNRVPAKLRAKDGSWVGIAGRQRILVYNTELVKTSELPASVVDLTKDQYKGKVGVAPSNASFQDFVAGLNQLVGPEQASAWLKGMADNGAKAYAKNGAIVEAVARGEVPMGLVNHYYVTETLAEDPATPIAAHRFPGDDPGSLFLVATASVPAPAKDNAQAIALIDFLLSDEGQTLIVEGEGEYPVVEGVALEEGTPSLTESDYPSYDLTGVTDLKALSDQIKESGLAK
jgi:iron(III) transport system substrate-binding protein